MILSFLQSKLRIISEFGSKYGTALPQSDPYVIHFKNSLADMDKEEKSSKLLYSGKRRGEGRRVKGLKASACSF
jgi:hypothetical protein